MHRAAPVALALVLGALAIALWTRDAADVPDPTSPPLPPVSATAGAGAASERAEAPLSPSLRGTEIDGALLVDARGHFRPTPDALDFFDYFLSASGEEPLEVLRQRIRAAIEARLEAPAREEALALLERYLAYREAARALYSEDAAALDLEHRFQRLRELRREAFGPEIAEALFGAEEARWRVDLERRRIARDAELSDDERAKALAALAAERPEAVRATESAVMAAVTLRHDEARLRAEGASPAEISALRERRFGRDATQRLDALDRQRAAWDDRVERYAEARDHLLEREFDDRAERDSALAELRDSHFEGGERRRIEALDRLADRD